MKHAVKILLLLAAALVVPACDDGDTNVTNVTNPGSGVSSPASGSILQVVQSGPQNFLVNVSPADPSRILSAVPLVGVPDTLQGFDYRPADGLLYGVGGDRLHLIDPVSGILIAV